MGTRLCRFITNITHCRTQKDTANAEVVPEESGPLRHEGIGCGKPFEIRPLKITAIFELRDEVWHTVVVIIRGPRLRDGKPVGKRWPQIYFKERRLPQAPQWVHNAIDRMRPPVPTP